MAQLTFSSNVYSKICFKFCILEQIIATVLFIYISSINNQRSLLRFQSTTPPTNRVWSACGVTLCYPVLPCYPLLPCLTLRYPLLPCVTLCYPPFLFVSLCYLVLPCVTLCYLMLPSVTLCFPVLPCLTLCYPLLP